jgi:hypothetical protein
VDRASRLATNMRLVVGQKGGAVMRGASTGLEHTSELAGQSG